MSASPSLFETQPGSINSNVAKAIKWPCNYNNKMGCTGGFIHIDLPPDQKPPRSQLETMVVKITASDNSHPPVVMNLFDLLFLPLNKMPCAFTLASHGMMEDEFAHFIMEKYPEKVNLESELAVYYYKKIAGN